MDSTLEKLQNQWNSQGVRILVLASLCIQIGLTFMAPFRKRSSNKLLALTIWLFYLTAELLPPLALGNMGKQIDPVDSGTITGDLTILWAPFLLLHLGGPDNITSYSIDDNELWWRLPLGLVVQVVAAAYTFWQSPPNPVLWIPTTLVCIAGLIKFAERTRALCSGSRDSLKDITTLNVALFDSPYKGARALGLIKISDVGNDNPGGADPANEIEVDFVSMNFAVELPNSQKERRHIYEGYLWVNQFKRLLVDITFTSTLLMESQDYFSCLAARDAFNMVSTELSFMHDILHTKVVHLNFQLGRVLRCFSLVLIIAALILFHRLDMQNYASKDIIITYILFGAGLALEVIAIFLLISSDWTVVSLIRKQGWIKCIVHAITLMVKGITFRKGKSRWSRKIGQFNLVGFCLREKYTPRTWIMKKLIIKKRKWDNMRESKLIPLPELLENYMFIQAKKRAPKMNRYNELVEARSDKGRKTLKEYGQLETMGWSMNGEFDECIILWHVATDICYYKDTSGQPKENESKCVVSWMISNYMVYLLTQQQSMMQLRFGQFGFESTCNVVKKIFWDQRKLDEVASLVTDRKQSMMQLTCAMVKKLFKGQRKLDDEKARRVLHEKSKGPYDNRVWCQSQRKGQLLLSNSGRLAEELHKLDQNIKWQLISEVWVNMLIYAAIHCDSYQHAKALTRGGELLTHVWLLMAQLGVVQEHMMR